MFYTARQTLATLERAHDLLVVAVVAAGGLVEGEDSVTGSVVAWHGEQCKYQDIDGFLT